MARPKGTCGCGAWPHMQHILLGILGCGPCHSIINMVLLQVYELLGNNYVEDDDNMFRCGSMSTRPLLGR